MSSLVPFAIFGGFFLFVAVAWYISTYNRFIKYKNRIDEAWSGIDVALKRRFNLIPNLIRAVEGYAKHEVDVLDKESSRFTGGADVPGRMAEESRLSNSLHGLLAVAEDYPDLKASKNFFSLQQTLNDIEHDIQNARNRFNGAVRRYNTLIESFPSSYIAAKYNFSRREYFTLELATQRELTSVDFSSPGKNS
ncbi:MAG: LemA family protein [Nitrospiraceae bacterium]|nr:MAG: LemA family protein [Nitrospiraceae bacterium]